MAGTGISGLIHRFTRYLLCHRSGIPHLSHALYMPNARFQVELPGIGEVSHISEYSFW